MGEEPRRYQTAQLACRHRPDGMKPRAFAWQHGLKQAEFAGALDRRVARSDVELAVGGDRL